MMIMRKKYSSPDLELIRFQLNNGVMADIIITSNPEQTDLGGGYTPSSPEDPFGSL